MSKSANTIESLKKLKVMLDMYCAKSDAVIDSYEKHSEKLKELTELAKESGDEVITNKLEKLQKIDVRLAKKILCAFSPNQ